MTTIKVTIKKIRFYNEDNGFSIFQVHNDQLSTFSLQGFIFPLDENEMIECTGEWYVDKKFGKQFKATTIKIAKPDTLDGMRQYLSSGILPGIGPSSAEKLSSILKKKYLKFLITIQHDYLMFPALVVKH